MAGALEEQEYRGKLAAAGFTDIDIEPTRPVEGNFMSAFIRARKPVG